MTLSTLATTLMFFMLGTNVLAGARVGNPNAPWLGHLNVDHVVTASSPDNTFKVLSSVLDSAQASIHISVYELDNLFIAEALENALGRGVAVKILLEGTPVPKIPEAELYIAKRLAKKGAKVFFYDDPAGRGARPYKYFHNKYTIVDGKRAVVGSGNYGNNAHATTGNFGSREWEVVLDDPKAAELFESVFENDSTQGGDWAAYGSQARYALKDAAFVPERKVKNGKYSLGLEPVDVYGVDVQTVFAPDNSLEDDAMLGALRSAQKTVAVEQLSFETFWGEKPYNPAREDSPMMRAILELARAGRSIRIVLNDDMVFHEPDHPLLFEGLFGVDAGDPIKAPRDNKTTLEFVNKIARRESLDLSVRIIDTKKCGFTLVHNKGLIVDGETTFVGSINWGESAMKFNREAAVLIRNQEVASYYTKAFMYDWKCSAGLSDDSKGLE